MIPLYNHAKIIVEEDKKQVGLFLGCGGTKTRIALCLAKGKILVICPKMTKLDRTWEREVEKIQVDEPSFKPDMTVISKEELKKDCGKLPRFDTVIVDEAHKLLGVSPNTKRVNKMEVPKTSGFYDCLSAYITRTKPDRFYPLTASMISNPMRVYAVARLFCKDWNFFEFRNVFYTSYRIPGKYFDIWNVKKGDEIKERLANALKSLGYVGRLDDWFDTPAQVYKDVYVELTLQQRKRIKELQLEYADPMTRFAKVHQIENGILIGNEFKGNEVFDNEKVEKILEYSEEFSQLIVVAKFTEQIEQLKKELTKAGKNVFTLTGKTKNSEKATLMTTVRNSKECILIVQAQVSYGWEFPECQCIVFASRTYNYDDYEQAQGRVQRGNNIKKNVYINLITMPEYDNINGQRIALNQSDKAVHDCLSVKKDFSEARFIKRLL